MPDWSTIQTGSGKERPDLPIGGSGFLIQLIAGNALDFWQWKDNGVTPDAPAWNDIQNFTSGVVYALLQIISETAGMFDNLIVLVEEAASGNNGANVVGVWTQRPLTVESDPGSLVTVSNGDFTLAAGKYLVFGTVDFYNTHETILRIYSNTNAAAVLQSVNMFHTGSGHNSTISGYFEILTQQQLTLEYLADNFQDFYGQGRSHPWAEDQIYSRLIILKVL